MAASVNNITDNNVPVRPERYNIKKSTILNRIKKYHQSQEAQYDSRNSNDGDRSKASTSKYRSR